MSDEHVEDVVYRPLQAWSRPHPEEGVVTVHFATREKPERKFTLTADAARELAIQTLLLMSSCLGDVFLVVDHL